jgi:hypothetical protein
MISSALGVNVILNANGCGISVALGEDLIVCVQRVCSDREMEWVSSPEQAMAIMNLAGAVRVVIGDGKPLPASGKPGMFMRTRRFIDRDLFIDWNAKLGQMLLRDVKTREELGRIENLAVPQV